MKTHLPTVLVTAAAVVGFSLFCIYLANIPAPAHAEGTVVPTQAQAMPAWEILLRGVLCVCLAIAALALYFLPAIMGCRKRNATAILVLNIFLGWTFLGWVVALVWATTKDAEKH